MNTKQLSTTLLFALTLLTVGQLRLSEFAPSFLSPYAELATPLYVGATIFFGVVLIRLGAPLNNFGFGLPFKLIHLVMALVGVLVLQAWAHFGYPAAAEYLKQAGLATPSYADDRFGDISGSVQNTLVLLAMSWTFAALGEEIAFRIVLLRGLAAGLGGSAVAFAIALVVSAIIFGFVHVYKGSAGMLSSTVSGLIFGALVIGARGAIWPAFLAHGLNNTINILSISLD